MFWATCFKIAIFWLTIYCCLQDCVCKYVVAGFLAYLYGRFTNRPFVSVGNRLPCVKGAVSGSWLRDRWTGQCGHCPLQVNIWQLFNIIILDLLSEDIFGFIAAAVGKAEQGTAIIQNQICLIIYLVVLQDTYRTLPKIFQNTGGSKPLPTTLGVYFTAGASPRPTSLGICYYGKGVIL